MFLVRRRWPAWKPLKRLPLHVGGAHTPMNGGVNESPLPAFIFGRCRALNTERSLTPCFSTVIRRPRKNETVSNGFYL